MQLQLTISTLLTICLKMILNYTNLSQFLDDVSIQNWHSSFDNVNDQLLLEN